METINTLKAMGIQTWLLNEAPTESIEAETVSNTPWHTLETCIKDCTACPLHKTRTQTVFGTGNPQADLLIIGEAPGENEDKQGEPFVGRAGSLLNAMLKAIGLNRESVFIANILKCRPPNNRDPKAEEVSQCLNYLLEQIALLQPKLILTVGRVAAQNLLNKKDTLSRLRNNTHYYHDIPVMATYHPAYLLRSPREKDKAYKDLLRAQVFLQQST